MKGETISHYRILDKLGEGGMGAVYLAEDQRLQRTVALKFLPSDLGQMAQEQVSRFYQEARTASQLDHPNIQTVHGIDEADGHVFIVMGLIEGSPLNVVLKQSRKTVQEVLDLAMQIADGLHAAHEKGVIHRDIKSANIMVTAKGQAKIIDFGLARLKSASRLTRPGGSVGTPAYVAPEQLRGGEVDHRADEWSFGVLLYEMLTGELPFRGETESGMLYGILHETPAAPSILDRRIPPRLDTIVGRLLQKDPANRPADMAEVARDLRAARAGLENHGKNGRAKAIAVLPFGNISPDRDTDYFGEGLTEELIANLSRLKDVRVVSRTTSMRYRGTDKDVRTIGMELGVRYVVEGSVRKFHDNLRITAQLVDVESDTQLWAETFKGKLEDVFDIQEQVSKQIVDALMVKLSPTEKVVLTRRATVDPEAFDCCLRARGFLGRMTRSNVQFAIQLFRKAIELDPRYAAAYAGLGEAFGQLYQIFEKKEEFLESAMEASLKAIMYDPSHADGYAALSLAYFNKRNHEEALTASRKALELDPENVWAIWLLGRLHASMDQFREAVVLLDKALSLEPDLYSAFVDLEICFQRLGDAEKLKETRERAVRFLPGYLSRYPDDSRALLIHASFLGRVGRTDEARDTARKAVRMNPDDPLMIYNSACVLAVLGDKALAVETLRKAVEAGFASPEWIRRDPDFDAVRQDPGYIELMKTLER